MEGGGCCEDFINACKYADIELKNQINSNNITNYSYYGNSLVFASCSDKDNCAKKIFDELVGPDKYLDGTFIFAPIYALPHKRHDSCKYDNTKKISLSKVKCETKGWCKIGKEFEYYDILYRKDSDVIETKICDACVMFFCTIDGNKIMFGSGCQDDFERICNNVGTNIKNDITQYIKDYFYFDKSLMIATCSDSDNCQENAFKNYIDVNHGDREKPFYINREYDLACDYEPLIETTDVLNTTPEKNVLITTDTNESKNEETATTLISQNKQSLCQAKELNYFGIIIFGFVLIYLW